MEYAATSARELDALVEDDPEETGFECFDHSGSYEMKLKRKLRFHFMNPVEKWQAKQRFPYKFIVQVIKIVLVTSQLCLFAHHRYIHVNYVSDNKASFSHLFLMGWDSTREVSAYPPAIGPLALYRIQEFYDTIDYSVKNFCQLEEAIGPYTYTQEDNTISPIQLCRFQFKEGDVFGFNESYVFNSEVDGICTNFTLAKENCSSFSSRAILKETIEFSSLLQATLSFGIKTVNLKSAGPITPPDCYWFNVSILFDNQDLDGQMLLSLDAEAFRLECKGDTEYKTVNRLDSVLRSLLNSLVIAICGISLILCARAIYRAQNLKRETARFFQMAYGKDLTIEGRLEFLNLWYVLIIVNDVLIILGSSIKEQIEHNQFASDEWDVCSVLLGTGNLLVWFGVLRYLGFFKTYNVVILTLKRALPKVMRFMTCALMIYSGFMFCGWLILGPYHMKFRSLASTSECLFAIINGDDMFATFSMFEAKKSPMLWWFSRIYLYVFITLYIYVVLSLFISVIMDAYDTIKMYYVHGFPKNDVQEFISTCNDDANSSLFRTDSSSSLGDLISCCCKTTKITFDSLAFRSCCGKSIDSTIDQADIM